MFEDPELQDPLPLNLNENCGEQTSSHQKPRKAPASSSYNCDPPEIQVIIKEEEEGWTVHENYENFNPEGEEEETSGDTCLPSFKACRKKSSASHGVKTHLRICSEEKCPEDDQSLGEQTSTTTEGQQKHTVTSSNEKLSSLSAKASKNIHQHSKTGERTSHGLVRGTTSSQKRNKKSSFRAREEEECDVQEQSTTSHAGEDLQETKILALYQTDAADHLMSHGPKMASENLNDRTLQLTVRLHAGEKEDEEEQDEEIGGLINSDGEVVEWDKEDASEQGSDCSEVSQPGMRVILSASRLQAQNQSSTRSPSLVVEVVSDEEEEEEEQKETAVKMTAAKPLKFGKRPRRKKKVQVESLEKSVTRKDVPANAAKRRSKRQISQTPVLSGDSLAADPRVSRRSQRKRNIRTLAEPEELNSKTTRCVAAKRPYRRRKDTKALAEEEGENTSVSTGKKRPGRKMVRVPMEIPPELLKKPKEKIEYRCSVCGKEFPHAYKLERHELIHTGDKPYCCSICGRGFNQKGNLKTHYKVHLGRKSAADTEDDVNPTSSELSEYLNSLPGESHVRSSFRCLECGMDCENQSALQAHHVTTHSETPAEANAADQSTSEFLFCRWCGIQFDEKGKMEEHMKTHIKEKPYSCPDCGKRFINESYIQVHQRIHTGERPFLCSQCGKGFHTASSLKLHEMQHTGERPFACSICGKSFRINSYLNAHYQTHIKDRPFICSVCGKGYSRAEELKVHHRLHTGERPYECGECGKSFIYRQGLRQHQRTHAGRRIGPTRQLGRPKQQAKLDI